MAGMEAERPVRKYTATGLGTLEALKESGTGGDIDRRTLSGRRESTAT